MTKSTLNIWVSKKISSLYGRENSYFKAYKNSLNEELAREKTACVKFAQPYDLLICFKEDFWLFFREKMPARNLQLNIIADRWYC